MEDDELQTYVGEPPWWLELDVLDLSFDDAFYTDDPVLPDEVVLDPLSVAETLLAASAVGPGGQAADLLASLTRMSPTQDQWLTAVQLWERQEAWLTGQKALAVLGFAGPEPVTMAGFRDDESSTLELALAIACSEGFAYEQIAGARLLSSTLSRTGDLLRSGALSPYRARIILGELGHLHPDIAQAVETRVIGTAAEVPTGTLRKTMVKHTKRLDRQGVHDRKVAELAEKTPGRRVVFDPDAGDGLMGMYAYLPPVEALAMRLALKAAAGAFRKADGRHQDEREADALTGMVLGFDPAQPGCPVTPKVKVGLLVDLPTLLGLRDNDGELLGYGHLPAEVTREIARRGSSWHRMVYDPVGGYLLDGGTEVHDMPALTAFIPLRDRRDRFPGGTRTTGLDLDHTKPFKPKTIRRASSSKAQAATSGPPDEPAPTTPPADSEAPAIDPSTTETPPTSPASGDLDGGPAAPSGTQAATSSPVITTASVPPFDAQPADEVTAGAGTAEDAGGPTAASNLAALSRRHHRAKTFLGFRYRQLGLGVLEWTTPLGRVYRSYPHDYRPEIDPADDRGEPP